MTNCTSTGFISPSPLMSADSRCIHFSSQNAQIAQQAETIIRAGANTGILASGATERNSFGLIESDLDGVGAMVIDEGEGRSGYGVAIEGEGGNGGVDTAFVDGDVVVRAAIAIVNHE